MRISQSLFSLIYLFVFSVAVSAGIARADDAYFGTGTATDSVTSGGGILHFDWSSQVAIGTLLGEPVVSARFLYLNKPTSIVPLVSAPGDEPSYPPTVLMSSLDARVQTKPRLYDVKIEFKFRVGDYKNYFIGLVADVGAPGIGDGETWSYNTPGSPGWDRLFNPWGENGRNPNFFNGADARKLYKAGLHLVGAQVISARVSWHDLKNWYVRDTPELVYPVYRDAERKLARGIEKSFGYPVELIGDPEASLDKRYSDANRLVERVEKLGDLPERFRDGDPDPYHQVIRELNTSVVAFLDWRDAYKAPGVDVAGLPQGYRPNFDDLVDRPASGRRTGASTSGTNTGGPIGSKDRKRIDWPNGDYVYVTTDSAHDGCILRGYLHPGAEVNEDYIIGKVGTESELFAYANSAQIECFVEPVPVARDDQGYKSRFVAEFRTTNPNYRDKATSDKVCKGYTPGGPSGVEIYIKIRESCYDAYVERVLN